MFLFVTIYMIVSLVSLCVIVELILPSLGLHRAEQMIQFVENILKPVSIVHSPADTMEMIAKYDVWAIIWSVIKQKFMVLFQIIIFNITVLSLCIDLGVCLTMENMKLVEEILPDLNLCLIPASPYVLC